MKSFWLYSFWNAINKILGFIRVQLQMIFLGDSFISDTFFLAQKMVALLRRIFIDGSFESLLISYYQSHKEKKTEKAFLLSTFLLLTIILFCVVIFVILGSGIISKLMGLYDYRAYSFKKFLIFSSPLIVLMFFMSFFTSILNANKDFKYSSPAPVFGNIFYILTICIYGYLFKSVINGLIIGSLLYALMQSIFLFIFAHKYISFKEEKKIDTLFIKKTFISSSIQLIIPLSDLIIQRLMIILPVGNISYIEYSHKILQFVFSIFVVSLSSVTVPIFAVLQNKLQSLRNATNKIFMISHILVVPICILIIIYGKNISYMVFGHITQVKNPLAIGNAISIMGISLYFLVQARVLSNILLSQKDIKNTSIASVILGISNVLLTLLWLKYEYIGVSWAINFSSILYFVYLLFIVLYKQYIKFYITDILKILGSFILSYLKVRLVYIITNVLSQYITLQSTLLLSIFNTILFLFIFCMLYGLHILFFWEYTKYLFRSKF